MIAIETLRDEVMKLPLEERAAFAAFVLDTLPPADYSVPDEEVARRWEEMDAGAVEGITMDELFARVESKSK